ncbi:SbcC/MukB-like Walker B domain-containing protein [Clostridium perfringens]|uniref:SbcC/MukB-like Walker B domain-containing protein n=1 Tax=Clostridium perfringens TaxID=1502 RepID=UPI000992E07D|nr:SbcC/MukB-like Walker B domain-containing protein [Clostridium perfringens]AQW25201.1 exonuclease SbcC [Clostridium perfringens]EHK2339101.1 AAA family ATPase [Clostridium perfringens]EIF5084957.1 AAA family ATPase [Clostridium perfringens]MDU1475969.1 SbcC/MukB-like Walker B domain-containing protein [Clostridium perfringens]WPQ47220.1 SbcC/MukB-like Walker B domain-containing protein [Clostridium perfringens]
MKPIRLEVKGLNSFIDKQVVEFDKLTERGLFGIFGPTGSGKSTILDGITLALYGDIARKSSNYINTNCDGVYVSYEFQRTGNEVKRYRVDREFKRDNKSGGIRNKSSKIIDITGGVENVLEEKAKAVTSKCEEIIGLKLDDFMRTVVLPQGKFSEFLKLEGKERRNMLERLFNLRKYGDDLSSKLSFEIRKEKDKMNVLEGQLKGYEGVSEEALKAKEEEIKEINLSIKSKEELLNKIKKEFEEAEKVWNTQKELYDKRIEEESLVSRSEEIKSFKERVEISNKADKVIVFINNLEEILKEINKDDLKFNELNKKLEELINLREENKLKFEEVAKKKEEKLPDLRLKKEKLLESQKERDILFQIKADGVKLKEACKKIFEDRSKCDTKLNSIEENEKRLNEELKEKEERKEELFVHEEFKNKINSGLFILNSYEGLDKQFNEIKSEEIELKKYIKNLIEDKEKSENDLKVKVESLSKTRDKLESLLKETPGDSNSILEKQIKLGEYREKLNKYKEIKISLEESLKTKNNFEEKLKGFENQKLLLEKEVRELKEYINKVKVEELAHKLRENLVEGECCPVCGSIHHELNKVEKINLEESHEKTTLLESKEEKLKELILEFSKIEATLEYENKKIEELNISIEEVGEVNEERLKSLEEEFNTLKEKVEEFNLKKENLEKDLEKLKEEKNNLENIFNKAEVILCEKIVREKEIASKIKELDKELKLKNSELNSIKNELKIEDIKLENELILKKEKEKNLLEKEIRILRTQLEESNKIKDELREKRDALKENYLSQKSLLDGKVEVYREKERMIKGSLKGLIDEALPIEKIDIKGLLEDLQLEIDYIEKAYLNLSEEKDKLEKAFNNMNQEVAVTKERVNSLKLRKENEEKKVNLALEEEGFKTILEVKEGILSKDEKEKLKILIEEYHNNLIKVRANIELLIKKLNGKSLTEEEWTRVLQEKNNTEKELKEVEELKIRLVTESESIKKKLEEQRDILHIKAKQEHKLALLSDLEKLFKGKKFVEFIAANQLKYISIEASKKLKDITNGVYGLEVDENGKFIIRDYKNGGAERDASTLSGGETFLASLALALSLSSQIQLKGTAPLELFFLDEGFGTLDDNLLDVVMSSLERLHHERLSVGIISHVESIKNRVPVKLILTPAEAGIGGSKVKIERS